jgi:hypothetical protein
MLAALLVIGYDLLSDVVVRPGTPAEPDAEPEQAIDQIEPPTEIIRPVSPAMPQQRVR